METTLEDQAHLAHNPVVIPQPDPIDINQEDDFDFEIGSDDGFDLTEEVENEDGDLLDQAETTEDHLGQVDMYQSQEQEPPVSAAEKNHVDETYEYGQQDFGASSFGDSLATATELSQKAQNDNQNDLEVSDEEEADKNVETFPQEEMLYEETIGEFEGLDSSLQPEQVPYHDLVNTATSVGHVHEGDDSQLRTLGIDENSADLGNDFAQGPQLGADTIEEVEISEDIEHEDSVQIAGATADADHGEDREDGSAVLPAKNDVTGEVVAEPLEQSSWGEDGDDDHGGSNASPIVTVSYRGQEYSMFAQAPEDDPDTYFLDGSDSIHNPLSQFLGNVREVISSEVEAGYELFVRINGLGLEFGESTAKDFLDQTTLAQIIEVNDRLSQNDGGSQHAELYIFLTVRSSPIQRFAELAKGAEEGHGLSFFEQYYEDSSGDASLSDYEEQRGVSQDTDSGSLSPDHLPGDGQQADGGAGSFVNHDSNPFQVEDQLSLNEAAVSEILGAETGLVENEVDAQTVEAHLSEGNENGSTDFAQDGDDNSFNFTATNMQAIPDDDHFGDSVVDQVETQMGDNWHHDEEAEAQDGLGTEEVEEAAEEATEEIEVQDGLGGAEVAGEATEEVTEEVTEEATEEQTELLIDNVEEGHERGDASSVNSPEADDTTADKEPEDSSVNIPNDEDYLDLGHNAENHPATTFANEAEQFDPQQRNTPISSATATLDGEENGQGDEAAATQDPAESGSRAPDQTYQNEDDEIDWNHEDDDDIGVADQNPTDLSPSSLSAKRSRQEDEVVDGLGEDSAAKRRRT